METEDKELGICLATLEGHSSIVQCIHQLKDGRLISGSWDNTIRIWDTSQQPPVVVKTLRGHRSYISCLLELSDGRILSGSYDKTIKAWDATSEDSHGFGLEWIVKTVSDFWDPYARFCLQTMTGHSDYIWCMLQLADGRIISGSKDCKIKIWESGSGNCVKTLIGHQDIVQCIFQLQDGRVVSGSNDHSIKVWDVNLGVCLITLSGHTDWVRCNFLQVS
jgi:WD40 repeat protein